MKSHKQFKSRREWESFLWDKTVTYLMHRKSHADLKIKLEKLFSERERTFAIRRLTALILIEEGRSYREVGEVLWISPATISQIKKIFSGPGGYHGRRRSEGTYSGTSKISGKKTIDDIVAWLWKDLKKLHFQEGYSNAKKRWDFLSMK